MYWLSPIKFRGATNLQLPLSPHQIQQGAHGLSHLMGTRKPAFSVVTPALGSLPHEIQVAVTLLAFWKALKPGFSLKCAGQCVS